MTDGDAKAAEQTTRRARVRWRRVLAVAFLGLLLFANVVRWDPLYEPPEVEVSNVEREPGSVRLMTLNCAHGRATAFNQLLTRETHIRQNLDAIADLIEQVDADVVALQELGAPSAWSGGFDHLGYLAERTGYAHRYHGLHVDRSFPRLAYGTGILSRLPLSGGVNHAFDMNKLDTKGFVYVEVDAPGLPLALVSVHLDFKRDSERRRQLEVLSAFLEERGRSPRLVVTGDFNSGVNEGSGALSGFAEKNGLRSPGERLATFPSRAPKRALGDVLLARGLRARLKRTVNVRVSDHLPVVVDLMSSAH